MNTRIPIVVSPETPVVEIVQEGDKMLAEKKSWAEFRKWANDERLLHFVGMKDRPGVHLFGQGLEYRYFPPETPRNEQFHLHGALWEELEWMIFTIPAKVSRFGDRVAAEVGLAIRHGYPATLEVPENVLVHATSVSGIMDKARNAKRFPIHGKNVRTLEYPPGGQMASIMNAPGGAEMLKFAEEMFVDQQAEQIRTSGQRN